MGTIGPLDDGLAHHGKFNPVDGYYYGIDHTPYYASTGFQIVVLDINGLDVVRSMSTVDNLHTLAFVVAAQPPAEAIPALSGLGHITDPDTITADGCDLTPQPETSTTRRIVGAIEIVAIGETVAVIVDSVVADLQVAGRCSEAVPVLAVDETVAVIVDSVVTPRFATRLRPVAVPVIAIGEPVAVVVDPVVTDQLTAGWHPVALEVLTVGVTVAIVVDPVVADLIDARGT